MIFTVCIVSKIFHKPIRCYGNSLKTNNLSSIYNCWSFGVNNSRWLPQSKQKTKQLCEFYSNWAGRRATSFPSRNIRSLIIGLSRFKGWFHKDTWNDSVCFSWECKEKNCYFLLHAFSKEYSALTSSTAGLYKLQSNNKCSKLKGLQLPGWHSGKLCERL